MSRPLSWLASSIRSSRSRTPTTLVVNPSSTGGSNETSPAQWTTASMSLGRAGTSARSPSTTATRAAISASTPPAASTASAKIGFSSSFAVRSAPLVEPLGRTSTDIRTSGHLGEHQVQQRLAHEAGDARDQDVLARQALRDRPLRHVARSCHMCSPLVEPGGALAPTVSKPPQRRHFMDLPGRSQPRLARLRHARCARGSTTEGRCLVEPGVSPPPAGHGPSDRPGRGAHLSPADLHGEPDVVGPLRHQARRCPRRARGRRGTARSLRLTGRSTTATCGRCPWLPPWSCPSFIVPWS